MIRERFKELIIKMISVKGLLAVVATILLCFGKIDSYTFLLCWGLVIGTRAYEKLKKEKNNDNEKLGELNPRS